MQEPAVTFSLLGLTQDGDLIKQYYLEVTEVRSEISRRISVTPRHLASHVSMKRILLDARMFYSVTRREHDRMLVELFSPSDQIDAESA